MGKACSDSYGWLKNASENCDAWWASKQAEERVHKDNDEKKPISSAQVSRAFVQCVIQTAVGNAQVRRMSSPDPTRVIPLSRAQAPK